MANPDHWFWLKDGNSVPSKMERFTKRARNALTAAQAEAERLKHKLIGPEHLLLGFLRDDVSVAGRVLLDLGLEQDRVRELIKNLTATSVSAQDRLSSLDLDPGTKKLLEFSVDEARRLGHHFIGTGHLLLGLVRLSEGIATDVLKQLGISPEDIRRQIDIYQADLNSLVFRESSTWPDDISINKLVRAISTKLTRLNPFARSTKLDDTEA